MRRRSLLPLLLSGGAAAWWAGPALGQSYEQFFRALDIDNVDGLRSLLARGFDPNTADERGQRPLYLALRGGSFKVAELLLEHPQTRIDAVNAVGETALMMAALKGQVDWMQRLLERGARPDQEGWTPLHYAATGPEPRAVSLLLDRGVRIDAVSPNGSTSLMMATQYGPEESVALLLQRGADAAPRNHRGETAADVARRVGRDALVDRLTRAIR
ncbi:MAG: ankyrin repeat domain-containing protein [Rubrivivax sp.]|jgi:ankyrin repeat protein|nr:ankyrin repeat domain-containing protein [Rubrivivax sp.]